MKTSARVAIAHGTPNTVAQRVVAEAQTFADWLARTGASGIISESGWPQSTDQPQWNRVMTRWFQALNRAKIPAMVFVAQGSPGPSSGQLTMYTRSGGTYSTTSIDTAKANATVAEAGLAGNSWRGIHVFGPDANDGGGDGNAAVYNNSAPGTYGTDWWYEPQGTYTYLASRGYNVARIPFKWERLQTSLNATLAAAELSRLQQAVTYAGNAGMKVVLDCHSYGQYMFSTGRYAVGSSAVPMSALVDLWAKVSAAFKGNANVAAYALMNEPHDIPLGFSGESSARHWEAITQACVDAIRANGDTTEIHVPTYEWSRIYLVGQHHPTPWIIDPQNKIRYDVHHYVYFDHSGAGNFPDSFATELTNGMHGWERYVRPWSALTGSTWNLL